MIKLKQPGLTLFQFEKYCQWYLDINLSLNSYSSSQQIFDEFIRGCETGKPMGHILGQWGFFQDLFFVDNTTLIPRPETELMVEAALKMIDRPMHVLEIGVGSGAVILSVMLNTSKFKLNCTATDISKHALELCRKNYDAKSLRLTQHELNFICTDRTTSLPVNAYDLILCNPPYIPENHPGVALQVHQFEPALALYLTNAEYDQWMQELFNGIIKCLKPQGVAIIEGHEDKLNDLLKMIPTNVTATLIKDLNHLPRFLRLQR